MKIATKFPKLFIRQKTNGTTLDVLNLRKFSLTKLWPINADFCKRKWTSLDENTTTLEYVHLLLPQPFYILKNFSQSWSAWTECKNERQERSGQTCAGNEKVEKRPCTVCNCNSKGSKNETCDLGGQCHCKPTFQGLNCDQCQAGHFGFPTCQRKFSKKNFKTRKQD